MTVLLRKLRHEIGEAGKTCALDPEVLTPLAQHLTHLADNASSFFPYATDVSYVDDVVIPAIAPALQLTSVLAVTLKAVLRVYLICGFIINWKP